MDFFNPLFIVLGLCGIVFLVLGGILHKYPPRKINYLVGYRTKLSMSSQEKWDFAQKYSAREMMKQGVYLILISLLSLFLKLNEMISLVASLIFIIISVIWLLYATEKKLKHKFNNNEALQRDSEV